MLRIFSKMRKITTNRRFNMKDTDILNEYGRTGKNLPSTHDVALYLRSLVNYEEDGFITQLMLYKLTYYAQAWSLVFLRERLFNGEIRAWRHGPVPIEIIPDYKDYKKLPIPQPSERTEDLANLFTEEQLKVLNLVWDKYGDFNASKLWKLCHLEDPWVNARGNLLPEASSNVLMTEDSIRDYYSQFAYIDDGEFVIEDEALKTNKDEVLFAIIELKDGSKHRVELGQTQSFFNKHRKDLTKKKFSFI
jgi:uncharacterized phage-associated protein